MESYRKVQKIAKDVQAALVGFINPESTEVSISITARKLLQDFGVTQTWYHSVPSFVLLGSRSCLSISGKNYRPANEIVGRYNLVTVDLSPMIGDVWGDCTRSFYVENGVCSLDPVSAEFKDGRDVELDLHEKMKTFVSPETKFSDLYEFGNALIAEAGYENLDFLGNLGHSIETDPAKRLFIGKMCHEKLGDVRCFTFEPHIKSNNGRWGFKHENIYYFDANGIVTEL